MREFPSSFFIFITLIIEIMAGELPDFMTDPNAVLNDKDHEWRYNRVPDYKKVNAAYEEGKNKQTNRTVGPIKF
jgi:hypothetical protein